MSALGRSFARLLRASVLALAACGGGGGGSGGGGPVVPTTPDTTPPTLVIANHTPVSTASANITFDFTFSEDVGDSFTAGDVMVVGGTAGSFTRVSPTLAQLVVVLPSAGEGTATVSVAAGVFTDLAGNSNASSVAAGQAFDTRHAGWRLVWADEFDTPGLPDPTRWDYDTERNSLGWYNNELQYYARDRAENARVEDGNLIITARKESLVSAPDWGGQAYTSARMVTRGKASWTYGLMEVRAKLPCGLGTWPAIWMLGAGGHWPDDGEIDIMEQLGRDPQLIYGTIHNLASDAGGTVRLADACSAFHTYQLTWTADAIRIGVDGSDYFTYAKPRSATYAQWPFDQPQYLLLNIALGGWGGAVDNSIFPVQMRVDYVRVYQRSP